MFDLDLATPKKLRQIKSDGLVLRTPRRADFENWSRLRQQNQIFLQNFEPLWPTDHLQESGFRRNLKRYRQEAHTKRSFVWYIHAQGAHRDLNFTNPQIVGGLSLSNIRQGIIQSATLGYWMGEQFTRRGIMCAAARLAMDAVQKELSITRFEAAALPHNESSIHLLQSLGFSHEGQAEAYLRINGTWQTHLLFGLNQR